MDNAALCHCPRRSLRKERAYALDRLAEEGGISKSYLWELENRTSPPTSRWRSFRRSPAKLGVGIGYLPDVQEAQPRQAHLGEAFFQNYEALAKTRPSLAPWWMPSGSTRDATGLDAPPKPLLG